MGIMYGNHFIAGVLVERNVFFYFFCTFWTCKIVFVVEHLPRFVRLIY